MNGQENGRMDKLIGTVEDLSGKIEKLAVAEALHKGTVNEAIDNGKEQHSGLTTEFRLLKSSVETQIPVIKKQVSMNTEEIRVLGKRLISVSAVMIVLLCGVFGIDKLMDFVAKVI